MLRKPVIAAAVAASLAALPSAAPAADAGAPAAACPGAEQAPSPARRAAAARAVLCLVNEERSARGLRQLRADPHLQDAAQAYVRAQRSGRRSSAREARERIARAGYAKGDPRRFAYGEALGHGRASLTPAVRVRAWLRNPATRRLLLEPTYRDAGVAIGSANGGTVYMLDLAVPVRRSR